MTLSDYLKKNKLENLTIEEMLNPSIFQNTPVFVIVYFLGKEIQSSVRVLPLTTYLSLCKRYKNIIRGIMFLDCIAKERKIQQEKVYHLLRVAERLLSWYKRKPQKVYTQITKDIISATRQHWNSCYFLDPSIANYFLTCNHINAYKRM